MLRSSAPAGLTHFNPHPQHRGVGVSFTGNILIRVEIEEELELDKDEVRPLVYNVKSKKDVSVAPSTQFQLLNDASTIGMTRSTRSHLIKAFNSVEVDGSPDDSTNIVGRVTSKINNQRMRVNDITFSPPFRRMLILGVCFVLLGLGVFPTLAKSSFKSAREWVELHRDR